MFHPNSVRKFPKLGGVTVQAYDALRTFIDSTSTESESLASARAHAEEFSLRIPDSSVGQLLTTLAASAAGEKVQTVAITPAASVVGLYLFDGLSDSGIVTCIDPEVEHQSHAKSTFRDAGYSPSRVRFLPSRPLDVMGRLATEAYHVIYADVPTLIFQQSSSSMAVDCSSRHASASRCPPGRHHRRHLPHRPCHSRSARSRRIRPIPRGRTRNPLTTGLWTNPRYQALTVCGILAANLTAHRSG